MRRLGFGRAGLRRLAIKDLEVVLPGLGLLVDPRQRRERLAVLHQLPQLRELRVARGDVSLEPNGPGLELAGPLLGRVPADRIDRVQTHPGPGQPPRLLRGG